MKVANEARNNVLPAEPGPVRTVVPCSACRRQFQSTCFVEIPEERSGLISRSFHRAEDEQSYGVESRQITNENVCGIRQNSQEMARTSFG